MLSQVFPNDDLGLTVFSGAFQYVTDLPWLNTVDIVNGNYKVKPGFYQHLNQYHSAYTPIFDSITNEMHSILFGGIGWYFFDKSGTLIDDKNVPFVKTVSMISRDSSGNMNEKK